MSFNWKIYKELNPDLEKAGLKTKQDFERHYIIHAKRDLRHYTLYQAYPDFDLLGYRKNNSDLQHMSNEQLEIHWIKNGRYESRIYRNNNTTINDPYDIIDKILYINLDSRADRRKDIEHQFKRANLPENKIERISAIANERGALGCTASHIKCLKYAIENKWNNVLILEDDFNFIDDINTINNSIKSIINFYNDWDVIFFSGNVFKMIPFNNMFSRAIDIQCSSGYLVNSRYYSKLLQNLEEGYKLFSINNVPQLYALDMYWKRLQPIDKWYVFNTKLGYQRNSYSDVEKRVVDYRC